MTSNTLETEPSDAVDRHPSSSSSSPPPVLLKQAVSYCKVCSFPPEYCEYGTSISKCKRWLSDQDPKLYQRLYPSIGSSDLAIESLSLEEVERLKRKEEEALKKEAKQDAKLERSKERSKAFKVTVRTIERTKRKRITTVHGLENFGIDLKKLAKLFASHFATGSSVTKNNQAEDEIVIQGDVSDEVLDLFDSTTGKFAALIGNGKIPDDSVVFIDDTKKKKAS